MSSELAGRPQSWMFLPTGAKAFISIIAALGVAVLAYGLSRPPAEMLDRLPSDMSDNIA